MISLICKTFHDLSLPYFTLPYYCLGRVVRGRPRLSFDLLECFVWAVLVGPFFSHSLSFGVTIGKSPNRLGLYSSSPRPAAILVHYSALIARKVHEDLHRYLSILHLLQSFPPRYRPVVHLLSDLTLPCLTLIPASAFFTPYHLASSASQPILHKSCIEKTCLLTACRGTCGKIKLGASALKTADREHCRNSTTNSSHTTFQILELVQHSVLCLIRNFQRENFLAQQQLDP